MASSLRSLVLQRDNVADGLAGQHARIKFAAVVWSLCGL
jgi:hypothetical protein